MSTRISLFDDNLLSSFSGNIILGSSSPRRQEILRDNLKIAEFDIIKSKFEENLNKSKYINDPSKYVTNTACIKGLSIIKDNRESFQAKQNFLLICADTIVECDSEIFEKPDSKEKNLSFIKKFQKIGSVNVMTAVIVFSKKVCGTSSGNNQQHDVKKNPIVSQSEDIANHLKDFELESFMDSQKVSIFHDFAKTTLFFNRAADASLIEKYIDTEEGLQVAGGFKIQGCGSILFESIQGDYFNVVGLPAAVTYRLIKQAIDES